jgi:hypothetical protein
MITELENSLFQRWAASREGFVSDGVVDEVSYLSSSPRIVFVLKEVNGGEDWDLRQFLREGGRSQTWDNVTRWVHGIQFLSDDVQWKDLETITEDKRTETLRSICAMNLKKCSGGHTTDNNELAAIAAEDRAFINEQFSLYDPDLTICCGSITCDLLYEMVDFGQDQKWRMSRRGIWFHERQPGKYVIAYSHPEARVQDCLLYYGLVDAVREIMR